MNISVNESPKRLKKTPSKATVTRLALSKGYRLQRLGSYEIPLEYNLLIQDQNRVETALKLVALIDYRNMSHELKTGEAVQNLLISCLGSVKRTIEQKIREYL